MAVAFVDSSISTSPDDGNSGNITPSGSDLLVCAILGFDGTDDPGITSAEFNTTESLTDVAASHPTGVGQWLELWYLINPSAVSAPVVDGGVGIGAATFSGADQTSPIEDVQVTESAFASSLSETVASNSPNDLVFYGISVNGAIASLAATGSGVTRESLSSVVSSVAIGTAPGETGNVTTGFSWTSAAACTICACNIKVAGPGIPDPSIVLNVTTS